MQLAPTRSKLAGLRYHPVQSSTDDVAKFGDYCELGAVGVYEWDYVDGIRFASCAGVVITGRLLATEEGVTARPVGG